MEIDKKKFLQQFIILFILIGYLGNGRLVSNSLFPNIPPCGGHAELFTGAIEIFTSAPLSIFDNLMNLIDILTAGFYPVGYVLSSLVSVQLCSLELVPILNLMIATFAWAAILTVIDSIWK